MIIYYLYGFIHKIVKFLLSREKANHNLDKCFIYLDEQSLNYQQTLKINASNKKGFFNENDIAAYENKEYSQSELYYGENFIRNINYFQIKGKHSIHIRSKINNTNKSIEDVWYSFVQRAKIPKGWRNSGFYQTGAIKEKDRWCLPHWIWTSAAVARCNVAMNRLDEAIDTAEAFLLTQKLDGGWIVRCDMKNDQMIPILAANDSAYIANNALLSLYKKTKDKKYLSAAQRTADWIVSTTKEDRLVHIGYDAKNNVWIDNMNIVDIGFTAGLFAELYTIIGNEAYRRYLYKFIHAYIALFYDQQYNLFATAVDDQKQQYGGHFTRGQAWALEGLIPAYNILKDSYIRKVIEKTVESIIKKQHGTGGWAYNLSRPLMGMDCKAASIIASALLRWYEVCKDKTLFVVIQKALKWCESITNKEMDSLFYGGMFSYSVEGSIIHSKYTSTAFVYANAYAIEVSKRMKELGQHDIYQ